MNTNMLNENMRDLKNSSTRAIAIGELKSLEAQKRRARRGGFRALLARLTGRNH